MRCTRNVHNLPSLSNPLTRVKRSLKTLIREDFCFVKYRVCFNFKVIKMYLLNIHAVMHFKK